MRNTVIIVLYTALLLAGCRATTLKYYVVQRDVPSSPSFVVLPFNQYQSQIIASEYAEAALIAAGVRVVELPAPKAVETRKGMDGRQTQYDKESGRFLNGEENADDSSLAEARAFETRIERYREYDGINTDYVVTTNGLTAYPGQPYIDSINIRIVNRKTGEVLSSFATNPGSINDDMYNMLESLDIKVKPNTNLNKQIDVNNQVFKIMN